MGEMITTRNGRVQAIMDSAQQKRDHEREWQRNWARLRKLSNGVSPRPMPVIPAEHNLFSSVVADNAWSGQRCFIIGGGESLKDFDFSKLKGELVIGVNRAYERLDCTIMFASDAKYYKWIHKGKLGAEAKRKFEEFKGRKVWLDSARYCYKGVHLLTGLNGHGLSFSMKAGLNYGGNSGYGALNLAVCLGANPIYLLGFDMKGKNGKQAHWHDGYPKAQPATVYRKFKAYFESATPILKEKGIKVINLNHKSALKCFEFGKFENIRRKTITAITPTGDRPLAFALCQNWMKKQTLQPDQWIVVDDGKIPMKPFVSMEYVRRKPLPSDSNRTLIENLKIAIPRIKGSKIVIIEDDEYYAPKYIEEISFRLNQHEIVGIGKSRYYHLPSGNYSRLSNINQASLAEMAFRSSFLPEFKSFLNGDSYLDIRIWRSINRKRAIIFIDNKNPLYVGMKGMPGRHGIGGGHDINHGVYHSRFCDKSRKILNSWIPDKDAYDTYIDVIKGKLTDKNHRSYFLGITGITVCYNTKNLIERAYNSVRKFHPHMPIVIIDGSDSGNPCASYVKSLASDKTKVISLGYNIGHGQGMCMGISQAKTKYALIFDSDIEILKSPVNQMLGMMEEDTFGIGHVVKAGFDGINYGLRSQHKKISCMLYLHPKFQLINIKNYKKLHPYVHHGAPCYMTMIDIHKKGLSERILKDFPRLETFVKHHCRGTRNYRKSHGMPEINKQLAK